VRNRTVLTIGVILLITGLSARPGTALPFQRSAERNSLATLVLQSLENSPRAERSRVRERILALREVDPISETAVTNVATADFGPLRMGRRSSRAAGSTLISVSSSAASPIPEPATGTMLIGGLLVLTALTRRRGKN